MLRYVGSKKGRLDGAFIKSLAIPLVTLEHRRCVASDLVDPTDKLLGRVLSAAEDSIAAGHLTFPPPEYCEAAVLTGLRELGMQSLRDVRTFLQVCRVLDERLRASDTTSVPDGIPEADVRENIELMKHLVTNYNSMSWSPSSIAELINYRIVPCLDFTSSFS